MVGKGLTLKMCSVLCWQAVDSGFHWHVNFNRFHQYFADQVCLYYLRIHTHNVIVCVYIYMYQSDTSVLVSWGFCGTVRIKSPWAISLTSALNRVGL